MERPALHIIQNADKRWQWEGSVWFVQSKTHLFVTRHRLGNCCHICNYARSGSGLAAEAQKQKTAWTTLQESCCPAQDACGDYWLEDSPVCFIYELPAKTVKEYLRKWAKHGRSSFSLRTRTVPDSLQACHVVHITHLLRCNWPRARAILGDGNAVRLGVFFQTQKIAFLHSWVF